MSPLVAYREGARRVRQAPALLVGVFLLLVIFAAGPAIVVRHAIEEYLGQSLAGEAAAHGFDMDWWIEFQGQARGLARDLQPWVMGFAAVLKNVSDVAEGGIAATSLGVRLAIVGWLLVGTFLVGGIIDRLARNRRVRAHGFFGACAGHFGRMLRLNVTVWVAFVAIVWVTGRGFRVLDALVLRDQASERAAFAWSVAGLVPVLALGVVLMMVADCSRVRAVVEDRRSMLFALVAGARFAWQQRWRLLGLYGLLFGTAILIAGAYALVAPGASLAGPWVVLALVVGQVYILARVWLKLLAYASVVSFFQGSLAHAGYAAPQAPVWPESPAVESLGPVPAGTRDGTS